MICHLSRNLWLCVIGKNNSMRKVLGVSVGLAIKNVQMTRGLRSLHPGQFRVFPARLGGPISSIVLSGKMTNEPIIFPETITALLHHLRTALTNVHMPISITLRKSKQTFQSEIQIPKLKTHFFFTRGTQSTQTNIITKRIVSRLAQQRIHRLFRDTVARAASFQRDIGSIVPDSYTGTPQTLVLPTAEFMCLLGNTILKINLAGSQIVCLVLFYNILLMTDVKFQGDTNQ